MDASQCLYTEKICTEHPNRQGNYQRPTFAVFYASFYTLVMEVIPKQIKLFLLLSAIFYPHVYHQKYARHTKKWFTTKKDTPQMFPQNLEISMLYVGCVGADHRDLVSLFVLSMMWRSREASKWYNKIKLSMFFFQ